MIDDEKRQFSDMVDMVKQMKNEIFDLRAPLDSLSMVKQMTEEIFVEKFETFWWRRKFSFFVFVWREKS